MIACEAGSKGVPTSIPLNCADDIMKPHSRAMASKEPPRDRVAEVRIAPR